MIPRTDQELRNLALYIHEGKVFGTWAFRNQSEFENLVNSVFMPFAMMPQEERKQITDAKVIHFYEFYDKAGPRAVNGYPMFTSMHFIIEEEWNKVRKYVEELEKHRKEFAGEEQVNWGKSMGG